MTREGEPESPAPSDVEAARTPVEEARKAEESARAGTEAALEAATKALAEARTRVQAFEAREAELFDRLARLQADFDNFRRRAREEAAQTAARGKETVVRALLPALDNLDRALAHVSDEGLLLVRRNLAAALADQGVALLDPTGETFDPSRHEALARESRAGAKAGTVLTVVERGCVLDGRLLRPARVVVADEPPATDTEGA